MKFKKICAVLIAAITASAILAGCNNKKDSSVADMKEKDMPYGATIYDDSKSHSLHIQYDRRFLTENEAGALCDYYYSIQKQDEKLFDSTMFPLFNDYMNAQVKSDINAYNETATEGSATETYSKSENSGLLSTAHSWCSNKVGEGFEITLVDVTNASESKDDTKIQTVLDELDKVSMDKDGKKISDKIDKIISTTSDCTVENGEKTTSITDDTLYIIEMDGKDYVLA